MPCDEERLGPEERHAATIWLVAALHRALLRLCHIPIGKRHSQGFVVSVQLEPFDAVSQRSFTGTLMLTAESRLGHLLPTDRSEATPRLPATAEADQPNSATAVSTTPQRDREGCIGQLLGTRQGSSGRR